MKLIQVCDLTNPKTGKTYRQENNEKQHKYKVDDLVEIIGWDDECIYSGMRLYIIGCVRDCDGTPLYVLGTKGMELYETVFAKNNACYNFGSISGIGEESLKLVKPKDYFWNVALPLLTFCLGALFIYWVFNDILLPDGLIIFK